MRRVVLTVLGLGMAVGVSTQPVEVKGLAGVADVFITCCTNV